MSEPTQLDVLEAIYGKRDFYRSDEIATARAVIALFRASAKAAGISYPIGCASGIKPAARGTRVMPTSTVRATTGGLTDEHP